MFDQVRIVYLVRHLIVIIVCGAGKLQKVWASARLSLAKGRSGDAEKTHSVTHINVAMLIESGKPLEGGLDVFGRDVPHFRCPQNPH